MPLNPGERHVHHHSALAGVGAGTAAVLLCGLLVAGVWHRVSGQVAEAMTVLVWALVIALLAGAAYAVLWLFLRLRHHAAHPETLTRQTVRAEVIPPAQEAPAVTPPPAAVLPPPVTHNWHLNDPATAAAVIRAVAEERRDGEGA